MRPYVLYVRACPGIESPRHFKIGISSLENVRIRLATYQNAVGPLYKEKFIHIWAGEEIDIRTAEKKVKRKFKYKISSAEAGLSEWICDIEKQEILDFISTLRTEYYIKMFDPPADLQPLTMSNYLELQEWWKETFDQ